MEAITYSVMGCDAAGEACDENCFDHGVWSG